MKLGFYYDKKFYLGIPNAIKGIGSGLKSLSNEQLIELGAKEIIDPTLEKYQAKGTPYYDDSGNKIKFNVTEKSSQEIYDLLEAERVQVFSEFELDLSKVAAPYVLTDNVPQELKTLTTQLIAVKQRIKNDLQNYLTTNNLEELKKFTFSTKEAEQFRNALNQFR